MLSVSVRQSLWGKKEVVSIKHKWLSYKFIQQSIMLVSWLVELYILAISKVISGRVPTCHSATLLCCPTRIPDGQHHDLISHSFTLLWHWANQSLCYHINLKCQVRKRQVSIFRSLVWLYREWNSWFRTCESHAWLIRPLCLVQSCCHISDWWSLYKDKLVGFWWVFLFPFVVLIH